MTVLGLRLATINEVRREMEASGVSSAVSGTEDATLPSAEAMSKIEDYCSWLFKRSPSVICCGN